MEAYDVVYDQSFREINHFDLVYKHLPQKMVTEFDISNQPFQRYITMVR
jgi:hypothetical protein